MTIQECITAIDTRKPNKYTTAEKIAWLSFLEFTIINEVLKTHEGYNNQYDDFNGYSEDDLDVSLIITSPYDSLYVDYIEMRIDEANGETSIYNASASQYNAKYLEFKKWYNKTHMPLSVSGSTNSKTVQRYTVELTDAERESIVTQLNNSLTNNLYDLVSDAKLYELAQNYFSNNTELFKGKDGKDGKDGKPGADGKPFTYADLTPEEKSELSGNAILAQSWAEGNTGKRIGENENNAKYYSEKAKESYESAEQYAKQAESYKTTAANAQISAKNASNEAKSASEGAFEAALEAESWAWGGTNTRPDEDTNNALYYCEQAEKSAETSKNSADEAKTYADASYRMKGEANGTGAVRLDFIADRLPNLVVNTTDVKSYGKNLVDFKKGTSSAPFSLGYASEPMVVTAIITSLGGTVGVQQKNASGNWVYLTTRFYSSSGKYTPSLQLEAGFEYRVNGTDSGFSSIDNLQLELGDKATAYEEYKGYSIGVVPYFPTTTLIANNPETEITATYNKDIGLVVSDLEDKIASLEDAIAKL